MEKNMDVILFYLKQYPGICHDRPEKNNILSQDCRSQDRDLNLLPFEYEAG